MLNSTKRKQSPRHPLEVDREVLLRILSETCYSICLVARAARCQERWKALNVSEPNPIDPVESGLKIWALKRFIRFCGKYWHLGTLVGSQLLLLSLVLWAADSGWPVSKKIEKTIGASESLSYEFLLTKAIERIPGLGPFIEKLTDSISGRYYLL